ncbi:MAG: hypothetical protein JWP52_3336, partial [Rhizobacter sp.]|nr:hypothetical protein [Rhizobacter sp.]
MNAHRPLISVVAGGLLVLTLPCAWGEAGTSPGGSGGGPMVGAQRPIRSTDGLAASATQGGLPPARGNAGLDTAGAQRSGQKGAVVSNSGGTAPEKASGTKR